MSGLLERDHSRSTLDGLLADVRESGEGRLIFLAGEAGIGKTSLLRAFCDSQPDPVRILWGSCEPLHTPRPLGPLIDIADRAGGELRELVARGSARPYEVSAALQRDLGGRRTSVVVIEDLHWADEATLDVLVLLGAKVSSVRALVLASYRDDELGRNDQLRILVGELGRRERRMTLQRLSRDAVTQLAEPRGVDPEALFSRTAGNPFFVVEVLEAGGADMPDSVRDAVLARAARLSEPARGMLETVAIIPGQVELWLLEHLAGELIDALDECLAAGMLVSGGAQVAFRHELARLAIEQATSPMRRVSLHRAALRALEEREPVVALLADHAEASADREAVLRWAPVAAEQAAESGAHREAAAQYARALRFADALPINRRAELLDRIVHEYWLADQLDYAIEAQREALECHRQLGDRLHEGDALRTLSRLYFFVGDVDRGEVLAEQAIALLEHEPPGHELAMAYANLGQRRMVVHDLAGTRSWCSRALDLAQPLDDAEATAYALTNIGAAELRVGLAEGGAKLEQALELARGEGLEDYAGRALTQLVFAPALRRDFEPVDSRYEEALEYFRERGLDTWRLYLLVCRARAELHRGRWDEASTAARLVTRDPRSATLPRGFALTVLGLVRLRRGDPDPLGPLSEEREPALRTREIDRIGPVTAAFAEAAWLGGRVEGIETITDGALALALDSNAPWVAGELAYWRWQAGVSDRFAPGDLAEPFAASVDGRWREAADRWLELGAPYEAALAMADGDDPGAMRRSYDDLVALGAMPASAVVARRLRAQGVRGLPRGPRRRTRENPAGLTARELEVLGLLAEGLRNADIAQRLVLSEKTVDHHVSAILRKLGVQTRTQAGAEAMRRGVLAEDR